MFETVSANMSAQCRIWKYDLDCFAALAMTMLRHLPSFRGVQRRGNPENENRIFNVIHV
jgi:hypothetical protein